MHLSLKYLSAGRTEVECHRAEARYFKLCAHAMRGSTSSSSMWRRETRLNGLLQITIIRIDPVGGFRLIQARTMLPRAITRGVGSTAELDRQFALVRAELTEAWLQRAEECAKARIETEVRQ